MDRLTSWCAIFTVGLTIIGLGSTFIRGVLIPSPLISIGDFIDLAVMAPFLAVSSYFLYRIIGSTSVLSKTRKRVLELVMIISFFLLFQGHGIHFAANSIHNLIDQGGVVVPPDLFNLIYFYDEVLGHKISYFGLFGLIISGLLLGFVHAPREISRMEVMAIGGFGLFHGLSLSIAFIEGQSIIELLILAVFVIAGILLYARNRKFSFREIPYGTFILISMISMIIVSLVYVSIFGGFIQPSELF